jgi:hypothetical protein
MHSAVVSEIWNELKRIIPAVDRSEAADIVVSVLVDNDVDPDEIKAAFKGDSDIRAALESYIDDTGEYDEEEYEEDIDDEEEEW